MGNTVSIRHKDFVFLKLCISVTKELPVLVRVPVGGDQPHAIDRRLGLWESGDHFLPSPELLDWKNDGHR